MLKITKVAQLPETLTSETIYIHKDVTGELLFTVTAANGSVSHTTKSSKEVVDILTSYVDSEIQKVKAGISDPYVNVGVSPAETWGGAIYMLQTNTSGWRIKRISGTGTVAYSDSTVPSNAGKTKEVAWLDRANLTYN